MASISDTTNISDLPNNTQIEQQMPVQQQSNISMNVLDPSQCKTPKKISCNIIPSQNTGNDKPIYPSPLIK